MHYDNDLVLHGTVVYSETADKLFVSEDSFAVCKDGVSAGVFKELPVEFKDLPVREAGGCLIIPGFIDLHIHAPQYRYRGNGMDLELLEWLNTYTFPEEARYSDPDYAEGSYRLFADELRAGFTTRACVFASADVPSTLRLMEMLEDSGLVTFVGKVNMDRNVPDYYVESTEVSIARTEEFLEGVKSRDLKRTKPMITPRFTPSCSRTLMTELGIIARKYDLPVQSHLSENLDEISWVKELEPDTSCYAETYEITGLMGPDRPSVMAHCVWSDEHEQEILKKNKVFIAHSPESNINLSSGAAPVKKYLHDGQNIGLATDIAGGSSTSMLSAMKAAVFASKLRFRLFDDKWSPLTFPEVFYLATKGGGAFFGNAGSFEKGASFDALIIDDSVIPGLKEDTSVQERLERFIYLGNESSIRGKYVAGREIL